MQYKKTKYPFNKNLISTFVLFIFILASCQSDRLHTKDNNELTIYTSVYPLQFLAETISSDIAKVKTIYPPGVDAHIYEPPLKEMTKIAKSDVFIYFGENMEGFSKKIANSLSSHSIHLIEIGTYNHLFSKRNNERDPHVWLDPLKMIDMAQIIKTELIEQFPKYKQQFEKNYLRLERNLLALDHKFTEHLKNKSNKEIIVSHAAYGYLEERYQIKQIPIGGMASTDEPSQKELVQLVKQIKNDQFDYIVFNQMDEHRLSSIIKQHTNTKKRTIHDLEVLTEEDINNKEDYFSLMEKNLQTILEITS